MLTLLRFICFCGLGFIVGFYKLPWPIAALILGIVIIIASIGFLENFRLLKRIRDEMVDVKDKR